MPDSNSVTSHGESNVLKRRSGSHCVLISTPNRMSGKCLAQQLTTANKKKSLKHKRKSPYKESQLTKKRMLKVVSSMHGSGTNNGDSNQDGQYPKSGDEDGEDPFHGSGAYLTGGADKPEEGISMFVPGFYEEREFNPKGRIFRGVGYYRSREKFGDCEVEFKGPNASTEVLFDEIGEGRMDRAELASCSIGSDQVKVKLALGLDTGVKTTHEGVEAKFLGTGISLGSKVSISVLNSEVSIRSPVPMSPMFGGVGVGLSCIS